MGSDNIQNQGLPKSTYQVDEALLAALVTAYKEFPLLQSSIAPSDQQLKLSPLLADSPRLSPADYVLANKIEMGKISAAILTAWGDSLAEQAEITRRELNSPAYLARQEEKRDIALQRGVSAPGSTDHVEADLVERYMWLNSLGGLVNSLIQMNNTGTTQGTPQVGISESIGAAAAAAVPVPPVLAPQFLLLGIAGNPVFQGAAVIGAASAINGLHAESQVLQGTWSSITNQSKDPSTIIAGWVSSLWGIGLIYQLSAEKLKIEGAEKLGNKPADINFAKTYAETILGAVSSAQFEASIKAALVDATGKPVKPDSPESNVLVTKAKIALLSVALALMLKLEEGTTSELSIAGLLKGEVDLAQNDPYKTASIKRALLDEIKQHLTTLDPEDSIQVLTNLLAYMGTDPAVEEMLDQQKVFKNVLSNTSFENELIDKRPLDV